MATTASETEAINPATPAAVEPSIAPASLADRWRRWWFTPESPLNLAICRILFFGIEFLYHLPIHFKEWGAIPNTLLKPVWIFERLHLPILSSSGLFALEIIWKIALLLACVGLFTRVATVVAAVGVLYLLGVPFNYGKVYHTASIIIWTMGILALARSGDGLSIDALLRRRRGRAPPAPSGEYRWPVRLVWVMMAVLFFNAGMAKIIRGPVIPWIFSENMAILMTQRHYMNEPPTLSWGLFIARYPALYVMFAAGSIFAETFCFVALFLRNPWRLALPLMLFSMQVGIGLMMRVWFTPYMVVYLFWIPWADVWRWMKSGREKEKRTGMAPVDQAAAI